MYITKRHIAFYAYLPKKAVGAGLSFVLMGIADPAVE
jgi:hypothetical protein